MFRFNSILALHAILLVHQHALSSSSSLLRGVSIEDDNEKDYYSITRSLYILSHFADPKTMQNKHGFNYPMKNNEARPLNILALGGSQTWGAKLNNRFDAYPWLMGHPFPDHVDNVATRATGADYPSVCVETIVPRNHAEGRATYDLILVEFVMNGTDGLELLLRRLRDRYPDAVIVYVGLWSLVSTAMEEGTKKSVNDIGKDPSVNWVWKAGDFFTRSIDPNRNCHREVCTVQKINELLQSVGGYVYEFPRPDSPSEPIKEGWFVDDWHHFSEKGHRLIADDLVRFLLDKHHELFKDSKRVNAEILGDQCYNWFETGKVELPHYDGGILKNLAGTDNNENKWVLEIDPISGAKFEFESKFESAPIGLGFMSRQEPATYPRVNVTLNNNSGNPVVINPNVNRVVHMKRAHITTFTQVGFAKLGSNVLFIKPLEPTDESFRVVGIYICGFCAKSGDMGGNDAAKDSDVSVANRIKKEQKSDMSIVASEVKKGSNGGERNAAAGAQKKITDDPKDAYYGVVNNRYRPENDIDTATILPRETLPPLKKHYGDMSNEDDVAVQFNSDGNF